MKESYWKRGSKEDALRIKQAFADTGAIDLTFFLCDNENMLYAFDGGLKQMFSIPYESALAKAIMASKEFGELMLPEIVFVPVFKVGTMIRWANPQTRDENWHMVIGIDNNKRVYRTKTWKSKDYEIPFEIERFYEVLPAPKPMFEYNDLVVLDDLLGRITDSKYEDGMWLYRVGCRNTWNFDYELMKADHRDEHRILKGGGE